MRLWQKYIEKKNLNDSKNISKYIRKSNFLVAKQFILVLASITLFFSIFPLFLKQTISSLYLKNVDPAVISNLNQGKPTIAYITFKNRINLRCERIWNFGKIKICKYVIYSKKQLEKIARMSNVLGVSYTYTYKIIPRTTSTQYNYNVNIYYKTMLMNKNSQYNGNITVGIVDTGVDFMNPYFFRNNVTVFKVLVDCRVYPCVVNNTSNFTYNQMLNVFNFSYNSELHYYQDFNGHGTFVTGEIVSQYSNYKGLAPGDYIVEIKAFNKNGTASTDEILNALQWLYNNIPIYNIKALSFSWGSAEPCSPYNPIIQAIKQIYLTYRIPIFVAAGNYGNFLGDIGSPACSQYVFAVGSWNCYENKLSWFSSVGPAEDRIKPDFVACGTDIVNLRSQTSNLGCLEGNCNLTVMSGTSMATPLAAACYSRFYQYYIDTYGRAPSPKDFIEYEKVNAIKYFIHKDVFTGYGFLQCP